MAARHHLVSSNGVNKSKARGLATLKSGAVRTGKGDKPLVYSLLGVGLDDDYLGSVVDLSRGSWR